MTNYVSHCPYSLYSIVLFFLNSLQASRVGILFPVLGLNLIVGYIKTPSTLVLFVSNFNHYLDLSLLSWSLSLPATSRSLTRAVSVSSSFKVSCLRLLFYLSQVATTVLDDPYKSYRRVVERFPFAFANGWFSDTSNWNIQRLGRELVTIQVSSFTSYSPF